jgi:hypothetical protein
MEVYMQSLEPEVRRAINSIHDELMATAPEAPNTEPPSTSERTGKTSQAEDGTAARKSQRTEKGGEEKKAPSRCKILRFAGKVRANRLEGNPLSY